MLKAKTKTQSYLKWLCIIHAAALLLLITAGALHPYGVGWGLVDPDTVNVDLSMLCLVPFMICILAVWLHVDQLTKRCLFICIVICALIFLFMAGGYQAATN
tara:strand:+ start:5580 stop:5885 length:306 start_codon:yes stop_codon:yes gene_type:complete